MGFLQVFEIQQAEMIGEEGMMDYTMVHLAPGEVNALPSFHRIVGEGGEVRDYCTMDNMDHVTSSTLWQPTASQALTPSPMYELQV